MISHTAKLLDYWEIAPDTRHFVFEVTDLPTFDWVPGQFVSLSKPLNGKKVTRAYSIASLPEGNRFDLCLNRVPDGLFSPELFLLERGDTIEMKGPSGGFVPRIPVSDTVFVATGTGVAPFRPMLMHLLEREPDHQYTLVFGVRYEPQLMYREEFEELAKKYSNFRFWPTITRPESTWTGRVGRIQAPFYEAIGDRTDVDVFVCGLNDMVNDIRNILKERGFDKKHIIYEKYD
jgi:ferredoxin-NADP reductase